MTQRTTREAVEIVDRLPFTNSASERDARGYAEAEMERRIATVALPAIQRQAGDIAGRRDRHAADLQVTEDGFRALSKALRDGDMDAAEAGRKWVELRARRRALIERSAGLASRAADTAAQLEDPASLLHSIETKFPTTQHDWPW
jgi:hypothetical protein